MVRRRQPDPGCAVLPDGFRSGEATDVGDGLRRKPIQGRAEMTVTAILQGAAEVLDTDGLGGFSTAKVASRAKVSIGTLYQYFGGKKDLLVAAAKLRVDAALSEVLARLAGGPARDTREIVHALTSVFEGPREIRTELFDALFGPAAAPPRRGALDRLPNTGMVPHAVSREAAFVLTRSILGVLRGAVYEEEALHDRACLTRELVRMIEAYVHTARAS